MATITVRELQKNLNTKLDEACMVYHAASRGVHNFVSDEGDFINHDELLQDELLHSGIVFFADAHAQIKNVSGELNKRAWVPSAKLAMRRTGLGNNTRLYGDNPKMVLGQSSLYDEMHTHRGAIRGLPLNEWIGRNYATRVAIGEIALIEPVLLET